MDYTWKENIMEQLRERRLNEMYAFENLVLEYQKMAEEYSQKFKHSHERNEQQPKISQLTESLMRCTIQISEKSETIEKNVSEIKNLEGKFAKSQAQLEVSENKILELKSECQDLESKLEKSEKNAKDLKDEHSALQILYANIERKYLDCQKENAQLIEKLAALSQQLMEYLNQQIDTTSIAKGIQKPRESTKTTNQTQLLQHVQKSIIPTTVSSNLLCDKDIYHVSAFRRTDRILVSHGNIIAFYRLLNDKLMLESKLPLSKDVANSVDVDDSDTTAISAHSDGTVSVWSINERKLKDILFGHTARAQCAKFAHHDSSSAYSGARDKCIIQWDLIRARKTTIIPVTSFVNDLILMISEHGCGVSAHLDSYVRFWDPRITNKNMVNTELQHEACVTCVSNADRYRSIFACTKTSKIYQWDLRSISQPIKIFQDAAFEVKTDYSRISVSPDQAYLCGSSKNGLVVMWDISNDSPVKSISCHKLPIISAIWNNDGSKFYSADMKRLVSWK